MATAIDDQIIEDKDIVVGTDTRGYELSVYVLSERLTQLDVHDIVLDAGHGDYEYVAGLLTQGFRGYASMAPGELWTEWKEREERFYACRDQGILPYEFEDDPDGQV